MFFCCPVHLLKREDIFPLSTNKMMIFEIIITTISQCFSQQMILFGMAFTSVTEEKSTDTADEIVFT